MVATEMARRQVAESISRASTGDSALNNKVYRHSNKEPSYVNTPECESGELG